jgi:NAD(P)-dependent dehydrogenase (short-subunit alcohol dehydrogenase family)
MMKKWTLEDARDVTGKNVVITGANTGLGYETALAMAGLKAHVIMACRSDKRATDAKEKILKQYPNATIDVMVVDLGDLQSIKSFVTAYKGQYKTLDILINNAGVMMTPYMKTTDGFEFQNGINHLGHFALTAQLFDTLKATKDSRLVIVSSIAHRDGRMHFDDYMFEDPKNYKPSKSYGQSKLSNLLFMYELNRRMKGKGYSVKVLAAHPGVSRTDLTRYMFNKVIAFFVKPLIYLFTQSAKRGALPQLRAALDPYAKTNEYYGPDGFKEMYGNAIVVDALPHAHNEADAKTLWNLSEELTGITFNV